METEELEISSFYRDYRLKMMDDDEFFGKVMRGVKKKMEWLTKRMAKNQ